MRCGPSCLLSVFLVRDSWPILQPTFALPKPRVYPRKLHPCTFLRSIGLPHAGFHQAHYRPVTSNLIIPGATKRTKHGGEGHVRCHSLANDSFLDPFGFCEVALAPCVARDGGQSIMNSTFLTETEATRMFVQPLQGEHLPSLLKRCIFRIQTKRARAYSALDDALRSSASPWTRSKRVARPSNQSEPFATTDDSVLNPDYAVVCANVTEDLKLCSEAVIELRSVLSNYRTVDGPLRDAPHGEIRMVVKWLDNIQDLEERKLVSTVSMHALSRSIRTKSGPSRDTPITSEAKDETSPVSLTPEAAKEKIASYARDLNAINEEINETLQEIREYSLDGEE